MRLLPPLVGLLWWALSFDSFSQGLATQYTFTSLTNLLARDPRSFAKENRATVTVLGRETVGDMGTPVVLTYSETDTATERDGCVWAPSNGVGRYRSRECEEGTFNVRRFGAPITGTNDATAGIGSAGRALQLAGGGTLVFPAGNYLVRTTVDPVASFTNLTGITIASENARFETDQLGDASFSAVSLTNSGTAATAIWSSAHGLSAGRIFVIKSSTDAAFDGVWTVVSSNSPTSLSFTLTSYNVPSGPATAMAHVSDTAPTLFRFDTCTNVNLGRITFAGPVHPRDIQYRLGWRVVEARKGTRNLRGDINVVGASYGFYSGEYGYQSLSGCSDLRVNVAAAGVGYPVQATGVDDSIFSVVSENVHRGGYFGGVKRSTANIWLKNWDVAGGIVTHQPDATNSFGCEDFDLNVWDTGTTEPIRLLAVGGSRYLASVSGYSNTNEVRHKNIRIRVHGQNIVQTGGLRIGTFGTNHWIEGLTFGGRLDQSGIGDTQVRSPIDIYETASTAGQFKDIAFRDFTFLSPTNSGAYPAYVRMANPVNDVEFEDYSVQGVSTSIQLLPGIHPVTVVKFPDWQHDSFEAAAGQKVLGGIRLAGYPTIAPMEASLGTNDFTLQWIGEVPTGDSGLFVVTSTSSATNASFGASVASGDLIVRAYGSNATNWIGVTCPNWASDRAGKIVSLGIVRTSSGVAVYTDGHTTEAVATTSGTPPAWTDAIAGQNTYLGTDQPGSSYGGVVYRFAIWNSDRSSDFPDLATRWRSGELTTGSSVELIGPSTANGSFETIGGGGADVFGSWSETTTGTSTITASTNAVHGSTSLRFNVDTNAGFAGVTSSATMVVGSTYAVEFWARMGDGAASGQIALVGSAGGDYPISLSASWNKYRVARPWVSSSLSIKRYNLSGQSAELDDVRVFRAGPLCDFDWTIGPADRVTGKFTGVLGGAASRVMSRGLGMADDRGNNDANLEAGHDAPVQLFATALTAPRTITLYTNHCRRGDVFRIVRTGAGVGSLSIADPAHAIEVNRWVDVAWNGSAWIVVGTGSLTDEFLVDAPIDGNYYARRNGAWAVATGGGGGPTNGSIVSVDGVYQSALNISDGSEVTVTMTSSNAWFSIPDNTIDTNELTTAAFAALVNRTNHYGNLGWSYVTGTPTSLAGYGITDAQSTNPVLTTLATLNGGSLTNLNDDNISFDDADNLWTATAIGPALEELNDSINAGVPNGTGAKLHWSQLLGVPAGFSDGTDDGAGGGSGDVVGPASATDGRLVLFDGITGKLIKMGTLSEASLALLNSVNAFTAANTHSGTEKFTGLVTLNGGWTPFTNSTRVVFEGDSLSPYIGNEGQTNWSKYLTNSFSSLNLTVGTNAATSGQQISQMLTDYASQVQPYRPSGGTNAILFFWAGINDVYYTNYATAFTRLTNYWSGAKADGFTLVGFTITDSTNLTAQSRADLATLNNLIRLHAPSYCDFFIDVAELLSDVEDSNWSTAGVHYTSRANEILSEHVRWVLLQGGQAHQRISGTRNYPDNQFRSLSFVSNPTPRAMVGGGVAFDSDALASGHGALVIHDGTTNTFAVAIRSGSSVGAGQVPVYQSDGTWAPQTPSSGSMVASNVPTAWGSWDAMRFFPATNSTDQATWTFVGAANPGMLFVGAATNETYFAGISPVTGNTNGPVAVSLAWRTPATETASNIVWRVSLRPFGGTNWVTGSVTSSVPSSTALTMATASASVSGHGLVYLSPFEGRIQMDGTASTSKSNAVLHAVLPAFP